MKQYKLKTCTIGEIEGCSTLGYFSYGHHDKREFADAVSHDWEPVESIEEIEKRTIHRWVKTVPWCGTSQCMFVYSKEQKKGYAPITVFEI
jgi:hypothetical protein